jgi:hypothetical protein
MNADAPRSGTSGGSKPKSAMSTRANSVRNRNNTPLPRLQKICFALPDAIERETWGNPTFRVREKIFTMFRPDNDTPALWCKAPRGVQTILIEAAPERFFRPPYVGHKGWIGVRLNGAVDWAEVAALVQRSYQMTAPKKLLARHGLGPIQSRAI